MYYSLTASLRQNPATNNILRRMESIAEGVTIILIVLFISQPTGDIKMNFSPGASLSAINDFIVHLSIPVVLVAALLVASRKIVRRSADYFEAAIITAGYKYVYYKDKKGNTKKGDFSKHAETAATFIAALIGIALVAGVYCLGLRELHLLSLSTITLLFCVKVAVALKFVIRS